MVLRYGCETVLVWRDVSDVGQVGDGAKGEDGGGGEGGRGYVTAEMATLNVADQEDVPPSE